MLAKLTLAILACLWLIAPAPAQSPQTPACVASADPLGCQRAEEDLSPEMLKLLSIYPGGGAPLEGAAYRMAASQPEQAFALVALANRANPEQMAAIARGLLRAFDGLTDSSPECRAGCMDRLQKVAMPQKLPAGPAPGATQQKCAPALKPYPVSCGMPIRAAMQCANQTLASLLGALARQLYATYSTASGAPRGCFAPIYQSQHNTTGWTSAVPPSSLPISRN